jgi:hypothetical protein
MKIKTISITYERKFNLGDYNSATCGCTAWADVDTEQELVADALDALRIICSESVKEQATPLLGKQPNARTLETFAGKKVS